MIHSIRLIQCTCHVLAEIDYRFDTANSIKYKFTFVSGSHNNGDSNLHKFNCIHCYSSSIDHPDLDNNFTVTVSLINAAGPGEDAIKFVQIRIPVIMTTTNYR